jgi:hypothetical protein
MNWFHRRLTDEDSSGLGTAQYSGSPGRRAFEKRLVPRDCRAAARIDAFPSIESLPNRPPSAQKCAELGSIKGVHVPVSILVRFKVQMTPMSGL